MPESMEQTQPGSARHREYTWEDLAPTLAALPVLPGLELLRAIGSGALPPPPFMVTMGMTPVEAEPGRVVFSLEPAEWHLNPLGTVHGGVLATLLDTCAACALHTTLQAGTGYTTVDIAVKYLRPVTVSTGTIRGEGAVIHTGRRTALTEARAFDSAGRLLAHATSTCLLLDLAAP
jgi:uncharacterized protein (TIGR00369 family)